MAVVSEAINEAGESFRPFANAPMVRAVGDGKIRTRYYARIAEQAESDEDREKLASRQRKGFKRAIEAALKATMLVAHFNEVERI